MSLKYAKPVNSSTRQLIRVDFSELSKVKPNKNLSEGLSKKGGRNNHGRLTAFRKGGGHNLDEIWHDGPAAVIHI